jgi:acyl carrier protein
MALDKKLTKIFIKIFKKKNIQSLKRINEEKWDSLLHVNLMLAIESEFNVKFKSEQIEYLNSFKTILSIIKKNLNEKKN